MLRNKLLHCVILVALNGSVVLQSESLHANEWPFWNENESIDTYCKRIGMPPQISLQIGYGESIELVLVPRARFFMGVKRPEPEHVLGLYSFLLSTILFGGFALALVINLVTRVLKSKVYHFSISWLVAGIVSGAGFFICFFEHEYYVNLDRIYQERIRIFEENTGNESPAFSVDLKSPFYFGKTEVTQRQYQILTSGNLNMRIHPELSASSVSWFEANDFCLLLSKKTGYVVRLPYEAEWDFGAKATTKVRIPEIKEEGILNDTNRFGVTSTRLGWEWCRDAYCKFPIRKEDIFADGPVGDVERVIRGGNWENEDLEIRVTKRDSRCSSGQYYSVGFRVVVSLIENKKFGEQFIPALESIPAVKAQVGSNNL